MKALTRYPMCGAALASLLLSACYVTTGPAQQPGTGTSQTGTTPQTGTQPVPPRSGTETSTPADTGPDVEVRDWRRRRVGSAAVFQIEPTSGPVGSVVTVYGRFRPVLKQTNAQVTCAFAGAQATSPSYMTPRRMAIVVPQGAQTGPVTCKIGNTVLWAGQFTVVGGLDDIFVPSGEVQGLLGAVYKLPANTQKLPNFESLGNPIATFVIPTVQVAARDHTRGFPGTSGITAEPLHEWYAIRFTGLVDINKTTDYTFKLVSDDGARLYIDNTPVIDNDGVHGVAAKEGTIALTEGKHEIVVEYFQGPEPQISLELWWKRGVNPYSAVSAKSLSRHVVEFDCSEKPVFLCCTAATPQCQECNVQAQQAVAAWEQQCAGQ